MSDGGERTCPLCAEEMDLTDQQLKPCKCGYEICVWCWHHIMDMAEKDETEGRCPACRSAYDKEKIVGMASSCERLVAEISVEKKSKSQKSKAKSSEGRKQLSSVRVIQRNLVYIVGLPLNLADEDLLQRREYFGQYGKVLKVSMSRTATGVIQQFPNNTCSVYITYLKEEEAVRCIQNVHQFVLESKPLRACFGTTKYCHAWLRNVPCTNPDCLYLHEVGSQEDSFTKDEIISAYTRSRVQQITGTSISLQRRSGNVLPPPLDDYCNNSSTNGKAIVKNTPSNTVSIVRGSPPNGSSDKSIALPAAASWGTRGSNFQSPPPTSLLSSNEASKKPDTGNTVLAFPSAVTGITPASTVHSEAVKKPAFSESHTSNAKGSQESLKSLKPLISTDCQSFTADRHDAPEEVPNSVSLSCQPSGTPTTKDTQKGIAMPPHISTSTEQERDAGATASDGHVENLCTDMSTISLNRDIMDDQSGIGLNTMVSEHDLMKSSRDHIGLQEHFSGQSRGPLTSTSAWKSDELINGMSYPREDRGWRSEFHREVLNAAELEEDVISFNSQRLKDPEVVSPSTRLPGWSSSYHGLNGLTSHPLRSDVNSAATSLNTDLSFADRQGNDNSSLNASGIPTAFSSQLENGVIAPGQSVYTLRHLAANDPASLNANSVFMDKQINEISHFRASSMPTAMNGNMENVNNYSSAASDMPFGNSFLLSNEGRGQHLGRLPGDTPNANGNSFVDSGESSIISNILSMDFNMWDNTLPSQNLSKLLGEADKQSATSWKAQNNNNNQSRFSFARQEDSKGQDFKLQSSLDIIGQMQKNQSLRRDFSENGNSHLDKFQSSGGGGIYFTNYDGSVNHSSNHSFNSSNKLSAVSRAQISAPPGFSVPSRVPPPGFSPHDRVVDQISDSLSGNHLLDASSMLRNSYQANQTGNTVSSGDIEFMDPAILAVGKGRRQIGLNNTSLDIRSQFSPSLGTFDNEASLQLLMQRSLNPQQNLRYSDVGDGFSHLGDSYGVSSRLVDQSSVNNLSNFAQLSLQHSRNGLMSHGHWDGWNEVQGGSNIGVADILRNDRLGYNKFYSGYEDSKFRLPNSGDLYNRTFGM